MELDDKECGLLRFLTACGTGYRMLMVECCEYLPHLRQMFPAAELWCAVADREKAYALADEENDGRLDDVHWVFTDYLSEQLPLEKEFFLIISWRRMGCPRLAIPRTLLRGWGSI